MKLLLLAGLSLISILVGAGAWYTRPVTYRYRITVEVETPQGARSGFAVHEVMVGRNLWLLPQENKAVVQLKGEAVAVDLPSGDTLYALLKPADPDVTDFVPLVHRTFDPFYEGGPDADLKTAQAIATGSLGEATREVAPLYRSAGSVRPGYPLLVTFERPLDPHTMRIASPENLLPASGASYKLKRVQLQVTADAVTQSLGQKLPWLNSLRSFRRDPSNPFSSTLPREVIYFRKEY